MIKSIILTLYISEEVYQLLLPQLSEKQPLGVAINRYLKAINSSDNSTLDTGKRSLTIKYPIAMLPEAHAAIARIQQYANLSTSQVVDAWLYQQLRAFVPTISGSNLIVGTNPAEVVEVPLEFGLLRKMERPNDRKYWYWRYYDNRGKRKDRYMGTSLDLALTKVREIGIPEDAQAMRKNKGKKTWAI